MADVVMMDQSLRNNNYHLEGSITTPAGSDGNSYLNESIPSTNNSSAGKLQYVKTYQTAPGQSGGGVGSGRDINRARFGHTRMLDRPT